MRPLALQLLEKLEVVDNQVETLDPQAPARMKDRVLVDNQDLPYLQIHQTRLN